MSKQQRLVASGTNSEIRKLEGKKCQPQRSDLGEGQLTDQEAVKTRDYVAWILPALNWSQAKKYHKTELQLPAMAHNL